MMSSERLMYVHFTPCVQEVGIILTFQGTNRLLERVSIKGKLCELDFLNRNKEEKDFFKPGNYPHGAQHKLNVYKMTVRRQR